MTLKHVEVENLRDIQAAIVRLGDAQAKADLRTANRNVAEMVVRAALPNVPVRTGKLRQSVKASASLTSAYGKAGTPARVPYAAAIHWGEGAGNVNFTTGGTVGRPGRNIRGRPFLWDAADQTINRAVKEYEDAIQDVIDKVVR